MHRRTVLITGANGYIGNAVAKAFARAGWTTYGLIRRAEDASDLAKHEIHPLIGAPEDFGPSPESKSKHFTHPVFDVVVSNTEDWSNYTKHFKEVHSMLLHIGQCSSNQAGIRPLVLFSSGCKDYGMTAHHNDPTLTPHTETSPLNGLPLLLPRTQASANLLHTSANQPFDITITRPTPVYGYGSSNYGPIFSLAETHKHTGVLPIPANPNVIVHGTHVDDCASVYVALAEHPQRDQIINQAFNISNARYETTAEICNAVAKSYNLSIEYTPPKPLDGIIPGMVDAILNYSQWVSSDKIRHLTGWTEKRAYFADGIEEYRLSYEAAMASGHRGTVRLDSISRDPGAFSRSSEV
ncbi:nucleoside-diphosphate-sugar epimerase [Aspergillus sclerotioniger CBS 115572]|uniref:Nucleoside-diphosphate-sugar epimerase n=1 Tax=Aspergillus sclerotioniger CBS 115572 TaxID=1450535 RepID=A0A317X4E1_9EURO|nr:nucleoside-diphosphate-sugar epimerase [Aspergillus sclerotioniger CBS 115572]PWY93469.1 nucleoside-diphosphate-sugar epimerase [Aspergillus sclerotioniger CBS 115572]